jgi:ketosteroid isomerase-like protein
MKHIAAAVLVVVNALVAVAQSADAKKIYDTEKEFERTVAEKGIKAGFIEFMAPSGVIFHPGPVNARESFASRPDSPAALLWNPVWIEVSSNGLLAYSIGNSIFKSKGKDDPSEVHGHYLSVWSRQPNGDFRALLDTGINHDKPTSISTEWKSPSINEKNDAKLSAADSTTGFWENVEKVGSVKAYKTFLADDAIVMRSGKQPFFGKKAAVSFIESQQPRIKFPKRKSFIESADLAYIYNTYSVVDKSGAEIESGNFIQVWKLRKGRWLIAADVWVAVPKS